MAVLTPPEAIAHAAAELAEAGRLLIVVERALLSAVTGAGGAAPTDLQQLDHLSQSLEELHRYLAAVAEALHPAPALDLARPLASVRLAAMRDRLAGHNGLVGECGDGVDLF